MTDASHGVMTHFEVVLVKLETDCGLAGYGYTYTIGCGGASIRSLIELNLESTLLGADANCIEQILGAHVVAPALHRARRFGRLRACPPSISRFGICGKALRLCRFGSCSAAIRARCALTPAASTCSLGPDELVEQTRCNLQKGFRAIKIKVGRASFRKMSSAYAPCANASGPICR